MDIATLTTFKRLFSGNTEAYGAYIPPSVSAETGEKEEGQSYTKNERLSDKNYVDHINGVQGLGIVPINTDSSCKFSVIDVDVYDKTQTQYILATIEEYAMPLHPFRSKSGGLHLYTFYDEYIPAKLAIENAQHLRRCLTLPIRTEVFPKQVSLKVGQKGNWINLPYFEGDKGSRKLLQYNGEPYSSMDIAMSYLARHGEISTEQFNNWKDQLPLSDAPPCLQGLYMVGVEEMRNQYLFSIAVYYKAKFDDQYTAYLEEANARLRRPISEKELNDTIVASLNKNSYTYKCGDSPLCENCDKKECRNREFSYNGGKVTALSYEGLKQFSVDPPYYEWTISGRVLRFFSEQEMIQQDRFIALCFRDLHIVPPKYKREVWEDILNTAAKSMEIVHVDITEDITTNGAVRSTVSEFFKNTMSDDSTKLLLGRAYIRRTEGVVYFKGGDLIQYVLLHAQVKLDRRELMAWLTEKGAETTVLKVNSRSIRVYRAPLSAFYGLDEENLFAKVDQEEVERINWSVEADKAEGGSY